MSLPPEEVAHSRTQEARTPPDGVRSNRVSHLACEGCPCPHPIFWAAVSGACKACHELQTTIRRYRSKDSDRPADALLSAQLAVKDRCCWACFASEEAGTPVRILARTPTNGSGIREVTEVTGPPGRLEQFMTVMLGARGARSFQFTKVDSNRLVGLVDARRCSVCRIVARSGLVLLEASSNESGELVLTVISPDGKTLHDAIGRLREGGVMVRILKVRQATSPLNGNGHLTSHQRDVLAAALTRGYYENPKRIRLAELGKEFGISKASAGDVLRRAEKTLLVEAVAPEMVSESSP